MSFTTQNIICFLNICWHVYVCNLKNLKVVDELIHDWYEWNDWYEQYEQLSCKVFWKKKMTV